MLFNYKTRSFFQPEQSCLLAAQRNVKPSATYEHCLPRPTHEVRSPALSDNLTSSQTPHHAYHLQSMHSITPMSPLRPLARLARSSPTTCASRSSLQSQLPSRALASTHHPSDSEHPSPETATHDSHYDPPSGWLFGVPPGEKYQKEGWENTWVYGFWGSLLFGVVAYAYKPDTS